VINDLLRTLSVIPRPARSSDEFYILATYGNFHTHVRAANALADRAGDRLSSIYAIHSTDRGSLTARTRGELAEEVTSVKVVTADTGLHATSGLFEMTGATSTKSKFGLDRFWRDLHTHTFHDPVAYQYFSV